jgi:hypothetical protein
LDDDDDTNLALTGTMTSGRVPRSARFFREVIDVQIQLNRRRLKIAFKVKLRFCLNIFVFLDGIILSFSFRYARG